MTTLCVCDLETFYDREFSLTKLSTEAYVRDPRFEAIGCAFKFDDGPTKWIVGPKLRAFIDAVDWSDVFIVCQNVAFDASILAWHYDLKPLAWGDTLGMSRALFPHEKSHSLKAQAERAGIGAKGDEVIAALGKRLKDFTPAELKRYAEYCINDVELTSQLFHRYMAMGFPKKELQLIDLTTRMHTEPVFELDVPLLTAHLAEVRCRKRELLERVRNDMLASGDADAAAGSEDVKGLLMSNPRFAAALERLGVEPPTKISPTTGKTTWAFAKTDEAFKALEEHPSEEVQALVAARLGNKTTLEETRTERMIGVAERGLLPVALRYFGAHTGRWSAEGGLQFQNLPRKSPIKGAIRAPEGYVMCGADLSNIELRLGLWLAGQDDRVDMLARGIDLYKDFAALVFQTAYDEVTKDQRQVGKVCLAEGSLVLTSVGLVPIEQVSVDTLVWDGVDWVTHDGPVYNGERDVITYDGVTATPDHIVYLHDGTPCELQAAADKGYRLATTEHAGRPLRVGFYQQPAGREEGQAPIRIRNMRYLPARTHRSRHQLGARNGRVRTLLQTSAGNYAPQQRADRSKGAVYKPKRSGLQMVRSSGGSISVSERAGRRIVGPSQLAAMAAGAGAGSHQQRRALRARQSPLGFQGSKLGKQRPLGATANSRGAGEVPSRPLCRPHAASSGKQADRRGNSGPVGAPVMQTKRRVWDILNAGPRNRFTAEGKLVSNCQLSLIYGTGAAKLREALRIMGGVKMPVEQVKPMVNLYREVMVRVVASWRECERALEAVATGTHMEILRGGLCKVEGKRGIRRPSGVLMQYPNLRRSYNAENNKDEWIFDSKHGIEKLYGSKVFQGLTQAIARDIMGEGMLRIQKRYPVRLTVHDSAYWLAPEAEAQEATDFGVACITAPIKYCPGLPLAAEAAYGKTLADC